MRLRFSSLLALAFLGVAAIALAYVGGVMTGRASASAERRLASLEAGRTASADVPPASPKGAPAAPPQEGPGILSPEELRFARALRNEDGAPEAPPAPPRLAAQSPAPVAQAPAEATTPSPGQPVAPMPGAAPLAAAPEAATAQPVAPVAAPATPMQDYVFQVGAFRDEESVDSLRQRLEGRGLRTRMQREGKLYVVLVLLRGDAARAEEVMRIAEELRLGKPMVRSRKPVTP
ncbi:MULTISPECIES: SPOR domain-containing protein [unclassified Desulfovibrio]|uniref:SPOR domain-containing protein n=1 Tax=unclassified Desulfovibrio TaxID=2593640 RepID=UPI001F153A45|nr:MULTISPECIES: SPOR domain-containing protein [unclassified Desulfovibrio]